MQEILPGLFLGPYAAALKNQTEHLKAMGITHIICVREDREVHWIRENMPDLFTYLTINMIDSPTEIIIPLFPKFAAYIDEVLANGKVLVHGYNGISRSATLVASYIMKKHLVSAADAVRFVQSKRFCIFPNEGFRRQLFEYEPILRASLTPSLSADMRGLPTSNRNRGTRRSINDVDPDEQQPDESRSSPRRNGHTQD